MPEEQNDTTSPATLKKKLVTIKHALNALTAPELLALIESPTLLREVFEEPRRPALSAADRSLIDKIADADLSEDSPTPAAQMTRKQREEVMNLQMAIWKNQGIADDMLALAKIGEAPDDPFGDKGRPLLSEEEDEA